jgi:hypothetical protein
LLTGLARATQHRRTQARPHPRPAMTTATPAPANTLTDTEQHQVLDVVNSPRFVDKPPHQVYATLLAEGTYLCSISTMYRILAKNKQTLDRRRQATHPPRTVPELRAAGPRQVYSWDITKSAGPVRGQYFDCYVMIDIYSRYIVGAHVHNTEKAVLAVDLMTEVFGVHGIPTVVHADHGTSMTSKSVAMLLDDLQVTRSHSRPRVSNNNPQFRGMEQDPAGNWQASALTCATCTGLNRAGRPDRARSRNPANPCAAKRPRQVRTVSTQVPTTAAITAFEHRSAASSTIWARTLSRYGVFWPRARRVNTRRIAPVTRTGQGCTTDMAALVS